MNETAPAQERRKPNFKILIPEALLTLGGIGLAVLGEKDLFHDPRMAWAGLVIEAAGLTTLIKSLGGFDRQSS